MRKTPIAILMFAFVGCSSAGDRHGQGGSGGSAGGSGGSGGAGGSGGSTGNGGGGGGGSTGGDGGSSDGCSDAAKLVYVIDQNGTFSSFQPNQTTPSASVFTDIGTLSCVPGSSPTNPLSPQPFSMSVDRSGTAWVEYQTPLGAAEMFEVSTKDASCTSTTFKSGQDGFAEFGMGFVADAAMSDQETLFIAGGSATTSTKTMLGTLDTSTLTVATIGSITGQPELTGTGNADLYGFFPDENKGDNMARISMLDKTSGMESNTIALESALGGATATAWAFAFWGGDFWVFLEKQGEASTSVYYVKTSDGSVQSWAVPGRVIVGAGVSTCAPVIPIT